MGFFNDNKLLNDRQLKQLYDETHFIEPFVSTKVKDGVISYGLSHSGYDIRIDNKFKVPVEKGIYDVKRNLEKRYTEITATSGYYILPPNAYVLGVSVETFKMPPNIIGIAVSKSTYARIGVFCNISPLEPAWSGKLVIEIANLSRHPAKIYCNEGIAQILFFKIDQPQTTYSGKYQNQEGIKLATVEKIGGTV